MSTLLGNKPEVALRERGAQRGIDALWPGVLVLAVTATGFWLRWLYVRDVSFFVDEYLTVRAAARILERGIPLLPSGNFYSHGLLLSYLEAPLIGLGATQAWLIRLPVLLLSTAAIPLIYWTGRRIFSPAAGVVAAALLAFAPEAILWGGRVRMYATLQFFVQAAALAFYLWAVRGRAEERPAHRALFVLSYWGALFSHAEAMILLPLWGLWALGQRGWRWCLRLPNLAAFVLCGVAIVTEILLRRIGPPVQDWVAPGVFQPVGREYLGAGFDWPGIQKMILPLFWTPVRRPLALLALAGLVGVALPRFWRSSPSAARERRGLAYLMALFFPALAMLLFGVNAEWKSPRYGLMLLPLFFLLAGGLLAGLGRRLQARLGRRMAPLGMAAAALLIAAGSWGPALAATRESVPAYDWALAYVEEHARPGDVVITFLCQAAFFHLGRCDYLAIPVDYQGFAFQKDGRWVSGWDEVPILDAPQGLRQVLSEAPGAWFVIDEGRFRVRYTPEFTQAILDGMELVASDKEMLVFHARGLP